MVFDCFIIRNNGKRQYTVVNDRGWSMQTGCMGMPNGEEHYTKN